MTIMTRLTEKYDFVYVFPGWVCSSCAQAPHTRAYARAQTQKRTNANTETDALRNRHTHRHVCAHAYAHMLTHRRSLVSKSARMCRPRV